MKACKDLKLIACPNCHFEYPADNCWVVMYQRRIYGLSIIDIKTMFIEANLKSNMYPNWGANCGYWFHASIKEYYPQYVNAINKLMVLL